MSLVTQSQIHAARERINDSKHTIRTPQLPIQLPDGTSLCVKLESLQTTGSFKIRGMVNVFALLTPEESSRGVVTLSAGNAGRSVASLAAALGVRAVVCMPDTVPASRVQQLGALGAEVHQVPSVDLMKTVEGFVQKEGLTLVHPFDNVELIAGHASVGLEILVDSPNVEVVVVPCGGGGLLSGVAAAIKQSKPHVRVIGVEPEGAPSMYQSLQAGHAVTLDKSPHTIAHGLAPPFTGKHCYAHAAEYVDDCVLVSDKDIANACKALYESGVLAEPSGCAAVAAVMCGAVPKQEGIVCVISGRNAPPDVLLEEVFPLCT